MDWQPLPTTAVWEHYEARQAVEVLFTETDVDGVVLRGTTTGVERERPWSMDYVLTTDPAWHTRSLQAHLRDEDGDRCVTLSRTSAGRWLINGQLEPALDGCLDVDLDCSAGTNTLPVHRLPLLGPAAVPIPAAFVRISGPPQVTRLEQTYGKPSPPDDHGLHTVPYTSSTFDIALQLTYDASGLITDYPGLARRLA